MKFIKNRFFILSITSIVTVAFFLLSVDRLKFDTDIINSLPKNSPVINDAQYIFKNHPMQGRVIIDISLKNRNLDLLSRATEDINSNLIKSGFFKEVGVSTLKNNFPSLILSIIDNLPVLLNKDELQNKILPIITPRKIRQRLTENLTQLQNLDGIGQAEFLSKDPLGFKNILLKKFEHKNPSKNTTLHNGFPLSSNGNHMLIIAKPLSSGTDTKFSKKFTRYINNLDVTINKKFKTKSNKIVITPVGSYRASLDNETIAKRDTKLAIILATIGIGLLLFFAFPRPLIGLLSLIPAIFGTMMSIFIFSLFHDSISILAVGFGGAIISITVDHGVAYLLFLDQHHETTGKNASKEIWSIGLLATLTTVAAFSFLFISGFPILTQIGQFAAMGILCSFIFVHTIFPIIFPVMPPAKKKRKLPIQNIVSRFALSRKKTKAIIAISFAFIMIFFVKLNFNIDLNTMNSVSKETLAAEKLIQSVWGNIFDKIYIMVESDTLANLQRKNDLLLENLSLEVKKNNISPFFIPSMLFPGKEKIDKNFNDWKLFWSKKRQIKFKKDFLNISRELGFNSSAFTYFFNKIENAKRPEITLSNNFYELLGIIHKKHNNSFYQFSTIIPDKNFDGESFFKKYSSLGNIKIFDSSLFSKKLSALLSESFIKMFLIIGGSVIILLLLFFFNIKITLIALTPIVFSFICTIGTLNIIGHKLDIPALMLSIIILGMGIDYSLYFVRSYQRYGDENHPSLKIIHISVFLASASTIIGFSALIFAEHSILKSAGITSLLGIGYSLIGAFMLLPFLLENLFNTKDYKSSFIEAPKPNSKEHIKRVLAHYKYIEAYPKIFAFFKIHFDPMFNTLNSFLSSPKKLIDIGCGYGVPSTWLLELFPSLEIYAIEPDEERARISSKVFGDRGKIIISGAPEIPTFKDKVDAITMLDMIHLLSDEDLIKTLINLRNQLKDDGTIIIRVTIPSDKKIPWERTIENIRLKYLKIKPTFRSEQKLKDIISKTDLTVSLIEPTSSGREETWLILKR